MKIQEGNLYKTKEGFIVKVLNRFPRKPINTIDNLKMFMVEVYKWLGYSEKYLVDKKIYSENGKIVEGLTYKEDYDIVKKLNSEDYPEFFI